jgi:hypothetical protein
VSRPFSVLILTEDSGRHAVDTIRELFSRAVVSLVHPGCETNKIRFEPGNESAKRAMQGNMWRNRRHTVDVAQAVATKLAEKEPGFVLFHTDSDCPWGDRRETEDRRFTLLVASIKRLLLNRFSGDSEEVDARLRNVLQLVPHYSVESWLYQNTAAAKALCQRNCGNHVRQFETWEQNRTLLDEVSKPKESTCLGSRFNLQLASERFPCQAVYEAGKSYAAWIVMLRECDALVGALAISDPPNETFPE